MAAMRSRGNSQVLCRALVIAAALLAAVPGSVSAFSKAIWGQAFRHGVNQFPVYRQLGASIYPAGLNWSQIAARRPRYATNPNDPAYRWPAAVGQAVAQAQRFHMRVLLEIIDSPRWAVGPAHTSNWAPNNPNDFAAFAMAAARRYPSVHLWMIWGEPNKLGNFQPLTPAQPGVPLNPDQQQAPHTYARLLDAAYGALKAVSRENMVIGGNTYTGDVGIFTHEWVENLRLPNGRPPRMDLWGHNPFGYCPPTFSPPPGNLQCQSGYETQNGLVQFMDLPNLARWIDRYIRRGLPIFLSEYTLPTKQDHEFDYWVSVPTATRYIRDALRLSRRWHRIYGFGWIHLYDSPPYSYGGLIESNGRKKTLFWAFAHG